jgi:hypothetical protein
MLCFECDRELELDEPQTCYFTGRGPCGDCHDPRTGKPPYEGGCFGPIWCDRCKPGGRPLAEGPCPHESTTEAEDMRGRIFLVCEDCSAEIAPEDTRDYEAIVEARAERHRPDWAQ